MGMEPRRLSLLPVFSFILLTVFSFLRFDFFNLKVRHSLIAGFGVPFRVRERLGNIWGTGTGTRSRTRVPVPVPRQPIGLGP